MTVLPAASAGSMTSAMSCARAARKSSSSVAVSIPSASFESTTARIFSPTGTPPGQRVKTASGSGKWRRSMWTDLPEPSPPSNTMNFPRLIEYLLYTVELAADDVVGTRFVEESFAVLEEIHVLNARFDDGIPARLTRPPVAPEVEVGADGLVTVFYYY